MKLIGQITFHENEPGLIQICPKNQNDLIILYNIIEPGDYIKTAIFRKNESNKESKKEGKKNIKTERKKVFLTIKIEETEYNDSEECIYIKGKNKTENKYIHLNSNINSEISLNIPFQLYKNNWDENSYFKLLNSINLEKITDIYSVLIENGNANLYKVTSNETKIEGNINVFIPNKRNNLYNKKKKTFFFKILELISKIDFYNIKCIIIGSPGFIKEEFNNFLIEQINTKNQYENIKNNLNKFAFCHTSTCNEDGLFEIFKDLKIREIINDTQIKNETSYFEKFNNDLSINIDKVFIGFKSLNIAFEKNQIDSILFTNEFIRSLSLRKRKYFNSILKQLKEKNVQICKVSSFNLIGKKIDNLNGVIGTLNNPIEGISDFAMVKYDEDIKEYIIEENNEFDEKIVKLMSEFNIYLDDIDENNGRKVEDDRNLQKFERKRQLKNPIKDLI